MANESSPLLPSGAEEFISDDMRALRFTDPCGRTVELRVTGPSTYEYQWPGDEVCIGWFSLHEEWIPFPWLRAIWAEMRESEAEREIVSAMMSPTAEESSEVAPGDKESLTTEAGDALKEHLASMLRGVRSDEEHGYSTKPRSLINDLEVASDLLESERASHAQEVAAMTNEVQRLRDIILDQAHAAREAAGMEDEPVNFDAHLDALTTRAEKAEALVKELEKQLAEIGTACGVYYETDQGTFSAPYEGVLQGIKDGYRALMNAADTSHAVYVANQRIAELETQLAEMPGFGVDPRLALRECLDEHGVWPRKNPDEGRDYEACIKHMAKLLREKACLFSETHKLDVRQRPLPYLLKDSGRFVNHHCEITIRALYPIGERIDASKTEGRDG